MEATDLNAIFVKGATGFRLRDISGSCGMSPAVLQKSMALLVKRGLLERVSRGKYRPTSDGLAALNQPPPTRRASGKHRYSPNAFTSRLWLALRTLKVTTTREAVAMVIPYEGPDDHLSRKIGQAQHYFRSLRQAGYLTVSKKRPPDAAHGVRCWILARNSGPLAPSVLRGRVYDHNTDTYYSFDNFDEVSMTEHYSELLLPIIDDADLPTDPPAHTDNPFGFTTLGSVSAISLDCVLPRLITVRYGVGTVMIGDDIYSLVAAIDFLANVATAVSFATALRGALDV